MTPTLVFDIETVPDTDGIRKLLDLPAETSAEDVANIAFHKRRQQNGSGFDLPVLHYRAMIHGIQAPRYWDMGDDDRDFKWNNYISRYHMRHLDLMDVLALYSGRANAPLDQMAQLCGFPGKLGMDGSKVWDAYKNGEIGAIRDYCETDVANTYLVFLRFQLMRGLLNKQRYDEEVQLVRDTLHGYAMPHWQEFLAAWKNSG